MPDDLIMTRTSVPSEEFNVTREHRSCDGYYHGETGCTRGYCWMGCGETTYHNSNRWCWTANKIKSCSSHYITCTTKADCDKKLGVCCGKCGKSFGCY